MSSHHSTVHVRLFSQYSSSGSYRPRHCAHFAVRGETSVAADPPPLAAPPSSAERRARFAPSISPLFTRWRRISKASGVGQRVDSTRVESTRALDFRPAGPGWDPRPATEVFFHLALQSARSVEAEASRACIVPRNQWKNGAQPPRMRRRGPERLRRRRRQRRRNDVTALSVYQRRQARMQVRTRLTRRTRRTRRTRQQQQQQHQHTHHVCCHQEDQPESRRRL